MRIRTPLAALAVASVAVSTLGAPQNAHASTARPSVDEMPLTHVDENGIDEPGARASSETTASIQNRSTRNLPGIFMAQNMGLGANSQGPSEPQDSLGGSKDDSSAPAQKPTPAQEPAPTQQSNPEPSQEPSPTQAPETSAPEITGSAKDKTEDGVNIASISKVVKVPSGNPSVVGVSYVGDAKVTFEVRTKAGDTWGAWQEIDQENTGEGRPGTEPYVVAGASNIQMRVLGDAAASDAKLIVVDPKKTAADAAAVASNAPVSATAGEAAEGTNSNVTCDDNGCTGVENATNVAFAASNTSAKKVAKPPIASRKAWGANERLRNGSPSYAPKVKAAIIHHTAGSNNYSSGDVPGIIRGIYTFHTKGRGWADVGYNVLVDKYGRMWQGRAGDINRPVVGAHAVGYNTGTFGISVMGDYDKKAPSAEALNAVEHAIAWKLKGVDANGRAAVGGRSIRVISAHRDVGNTDCPGDAFYSRMGEIRSAVSKLQKGKKVEAPKKNTPKEKSKPKKKSLTSIQKAYKGHEKVLGQPRGKEYKWGGGRVQSYDRGYITWTKATGAVILRDGMASAWKKNRGDLGLPTQNEKPLQRGAYQSFQRGATHWSPGNGAYATWGVIWKYWKDKGFERGHMGYPTSDVKKSDGQLEQRFEGARVQHTEGFGTVEYGPGPAIRGGANDQNPQPEPQPSDAPKPGEKPNEKAKDKSNDKDKDKAKDKSKSKKKSKDKAKDKSKSKKKSKDKPKKKSTDAIRREIIKEARKGLGTPYVWGGNTPNGWDCSGYTRYVYGKVGIDLPRHSSAQMSAGRIVSKKEAKPGDIIWVPGHVGIVSDKKGKMLDAGSRRTNTSERSYDWMLKRGAKFVRYLDD